MMANYDERNELMKLLERMAEQDRQEQQERMAQQYLQEQLQRQAAWALHYQQLLFLQQQQFHLLPHPLLQQSLPWPVPGLGPASFLEFDDSFLTPWQWRGGENDDDSTSAGIYAYDLESGVHRMLLRPGSFFNFKPYHLIEQIRDPKSSESSEDKQEEEREDEDNVKRDEGIKTTTASPRKQINQAENAKAEQERKGEEKKIRDGTKKQSLDKEGNDEEEEIVYAAAPNDNADKQAMKYMYQADRRKYKKTFSRKPGKA